MGLYPVIRSLITIRNDWYVHQHALVDISTLQESFDPGGTKTLNVYSSPEGTETTQEVLVNMKYQEKLLNAEV